ncbi:MAG: antibiotic biosynthesis monooxygenase [Pseudomonadales bacterium]|nr:antibiotic biosynthesis monooxygenase [Pseudomonadales bacterium]
MYAVILRATVGDLNEEYSKALLRMKALAFEQYGCLEFYAMMDGPRRIAISYWKNEDDILQWRNNNEHRQIQEKAKQSWYTSYVIQIVDIKREYFSEAPVN